MKQVETDVAVVGTGVSGLPAAVMAAERGARVIAFEKAATTGGAGNMGMGPFAVESRLQRAKNIILTREEAFKLFMDYTHWRVDARLVSDYINKSASTIDWLEHMGVEFVEPSAYFFGGNFTCHLIKGPSGSPGPGAGAAMIKCLTERAKELGVKIYLETPAKKILKEGGQIVGVVAEDKAGETIQAKAKAVIIGSGGFGNDIDMIKKYVGFEWGHDLFSMRIPAASGDGIRMAWEVGAAADEMYMDLTCGIPGPAAGGLPAMVPGFDAFRQPNLTVNLQGERFMNEEVMANHTYTGNALSRQKNRCGFIIFDEAAKRYYEAEYNSSTSSPSVKLDIDADTKKAIEQGHKNKFVANSLEELASKTGINLGGLQKTEAEYNKACDTGRDEIFHKKPKYLRPVKQPPFYAGRYFPAGYGTRGGIKINYKTEVLTRNLEVIPGLYAAGVDANALHGDTYVMLLPGGGMGFALNSGRIAGENATEYVKTIAK
jgi:fumarate reductase flavoprotein subunit